MVSTLAMRRKHGDIALTATLRMQMALRRMRVRRVEALRVALELRMVIRLQSFFRWRKLYAQFQHAKRAATSIEAAGRGMLARILRRILAGERKHRLIRLQANWRRYVVWCKWGRRINETAQTYFSTLGSGGLPLGLDPFLALGLALRVCPP